jgi:hypothetical protein
VTDKWYGRERPRFLLNDPLSFCNKRGNALTLMTTLTGRLKQSSDEKITKKNILGKKSRIIALRSQSGVSRTMAALLIAMTY